MGMWIEVFGVAEAMGEGQRVEVEVNGNVVSLWSN